MAKKLKIYIDESGDFGFSKNSSELYVISFILYDTSKTINNSLTYLKKKLQVINNNEMIHTSPLICNRDELMKEKNFF